MGEPSDRNGADQVGIGGFQNEMIMVAHQAIRVHLPIGFLTRLREGLDEVVPVHVVQKDVLALVATAHDVIDGLQGTGRARAAAWGGD